MKAKHQLVNSIAPELENGKRVVGFLTAVAFASFSSYVAADTSALLDDDPVQNSGNQQQHALSPVQAVLQPQDPIEPDFVPKIPFGGPSGPMGYCNRIDKSIIVYVKNQGFSAAPASVVIVSDSMVTKVAWTESIPPGETRTALVNYANSIVVPTGVWNFEIHVDPSDQVIELFAGGEENNRAEGTCII